MKRFVLLIATWTCLASPALTQCVNGVCRMPRSQTQWQAAKPAVPAAHHQAVCRVYADGGGGRRSIGSGVLIRYLGRFIVLTARHVIRDRRGAILVRFGKRQWHQARVVCEDATWDVAALEVSEPNGIRPAELAWGAAATPQPGATLESCGFGRDDTLRPNRGRLLRFMRPRNATSGDWLEMSGRSRDGDSGGPIFDSTGHVVGILWGTDGASTLGTQGGRVHAILGRSIKQLAGRPFPFGGRLVPVRPIIRPVQPRTPSQPQVIVQSDPAVGEALQSIGGNVARIAENTDPGRVDNTEPGRVDPVNAAGRMSPLLAGLVVLGSAVLGFVIFFGGKG